MAIEELKIGNYLLDLDINKTRELYKNILSIDKQCGCVNCVELNHIFSNEHEKYHAGIERYGLDLRKAIDIYEQETKKRKVIFWGMLHIVGTIKNGCDCWEETGDGEAYTLNMKNMIRIKHGKYGFTKKVVQKNKNWPENIIQMEIEIEIDKKTWKHYKIYI